MWNRNWGTQVKCVLAVEPGVYWGEEIFYKQTVVTLPTEHLHIPDLQG
jgi:hypothetical protein